MENKSRSFIVEALILAIALLGVGFWVSATVIDYGNRDRTVQVRGLAEREVSADYVIWPIVFKEMNNDLADLYAKVQAKTELLTKFLETNGISKDEISYSSPDVIDTDGELYGDHKHPYRYNATVIVTVASGKVELVRNLMAKQAELLKDGIAITDNDYRFRKVFSFNGLNSIKPAMIEEATRNAHEAAEKFALDSKSALGKIKTATQGQFSITDRDENTPFIKNVRVVTNVQYFLKD